MDVFHTMVIIKNFPRVRETLGHSAPQPLGTIPQKGDLNLVLRDARRQHSQIGGELCCVLDLVPTGNQNDAVFAIEQIYAKTLGLSPLSRSASAATTSLGPSRGMGTVAGYNKHR